MSLVVNVKSHGNQDQNLDFQSILLTYSDMSDPIQNPGIWCDVTERNHRMTSVVARVELATVTRYSRGRGCSVTGQDNHKGHR